MEKLKWGILGVAKIAIDQVIPAIQQSELGEVWAIASRGEERARAMALELDIPKAYGNYDLLLADPDIDVVYIPLPNHLHFPWIKKCLEAGKHVLCEKPLALNTEEVKELMIIQKATELKVNEAFMVKSHPQWHTVRKILNDGTLGTLKMVHGHFTYNMTDQSNVRYVPEWGGGGLYDVGCYPIFTTRHAINEIPDRVFAATRLDKNSGVDVLASGILDFPSVQLTFSSGMQVVDTQLLQFFGTKKRLELKLPFNPEPGIPVELELHDNNIHNPTYETVLLEPCNQYTLMCDELANAIINDTPEPVPLEDTLINTAILQALFESADQGKWITPDYNM
jgi:predicted dehydrogenase